MAVNTVRMRKNKNSYTYSNEKKYSSTVTKNNSSVRSTVIEVDGSILNKVLIFVLALALLLAILAAVAFGVSAVNKYITTSENFVITNVDIQGATRISPEEVLEISGVEVGKNIFSYNIKNIEQNLLASPWIESVAIKRAIPDSFEIKITERLPQFWLLHENKLQYLDEQGRLIAPVEQNNFISLPTLDIGMGGEDILVDLVSFMEKLKTVVLPFDVNNITWIKVSAAKGFELFFEERQLTISIDSVNWKKNIDYLLVALKDIQERNEINQIKEISVADGQVWLVKK